MASKFESEVTSQFFEDRRIHISICGASAMSGFRFWSERSMLTCLTSRTTEYQKRPRQQGHIFRTRRRGIIINVRPGSSPEPSRFARHEYFVKGFGGTGDANQVIGPYIAEYLTGVVEHVL